WESPAVRCRQLQCGPGQRLRARRLRFRSTGAHSLCLQIPKGVHCRAAPTSPSRLGSAASALTVSPSVRAASDVDEPMATIRALESTTTWLTKPVAADGLARKTRSTFNV